MRNKLRISDNLLRKGFKSYHWTSGDAGRNIKVSQVEPRVKGLGETMRVNELVMVLLFSKELGLNYV